MPRQPALGGGALAKNPAAASWGVSAFAFQGTNAHVLLAGRTSDAAAAAETVARPVSWQRQRFWFSPEPHLLVGLVRAAGKALAFQVNLSQAKHAHLWDHAVSGRPLLPGAAFLELAAASLYLTNAQKEAQIVAGATIPMPLELPADGAVSMMLTCFVEDSGRLRVSSASARSVARDHMYGTSTWLTQSTFNCDETRRAAKRLRILGPAFKRVSSSHSAQAAAVGAVAGSNRCSKEALIGTDPACLDAAFHLGALPRIGQRAELRVPAAIQAYLSSFACSSKQEQSAGCQGLVLPTAGRAAKYDFWLCGASQPACKVAGLEARPLGSVNRHSTVAGAVADVHTASYELCWNAAAVGLQAEGLFGVSVAPDVSGEAPDSVCAAGIQLLQQANTGAALIASGMQANVPALTVDSVSPGAGLLYGLVKAAAQESTQYNFQTVHGDVHSSASSKLVLGERFAKDAHGGMQRGGAVFSPLLRPLTKADRTLPAFHLMPQPRGAISNLMPLPVEVEAAGHGEVVMAVKAVGVNFRWVRVPQCSVRTLS
jgi:hypothetical protein